MSSIASVVLVNVVLALCGLGVLAVLGVASSPKGLLRAAVIAPLAGMAWVGIAAATTATLGFSFGVIGLIAVTLATCAGGAARLRTSDDPSSVVKPRKGMTWPELGTAAAALITIGVVCAFALATYAVKPLVEYDGWAMWGMKARALATLGGDPAVFASDTYARLHLEYPLLLPALHALPIETADEFSSNIVVLQCVAIGMAGLLAIWGLLREVVRPALLLAFLAAIAAMPAFFLQLGSGYADVPLAVFVACGLAAAARWLTDDGGHWLALGTLFLAAAVLTKNEGLLAAAAMYIPLLVLATGRRRAVAASAVVVALVYAPWRLYVAFHDLGAPDYNLSSSFNAPWVVRRLDRIPESAAGLLEEAIDPRQFGLALVVGAAATALALLLGVRQLGLLAAGYALLSLAGLVWIYVLTPSDVSDFLSSNASRIVMALVVGLATLSPLLIEQCLQKLSGREEVVGTPS
jgi:hypothetical protein